MNVVFRKNERGDLIFRTSKLLFVFFWILMILEGAIRKWVAPEVGVPIQVLRDLLPLVVLLLLVQSKSPMPAPPRAITLPLTGYLLCGLFSASVSGFSYPFLVPFLGLRTHFAYIPLIFAFPAFYRSLQSLLSSAVKIAAVAIPISLLCVFQTTQSSNSWVNIYANGENANAAFGNESLVRASGTFSYITGMAQFAILVFTVCLVGVITAERPRQRLIFVAGLWAAIVAAITTGSRGPIFAMVIVVAGVLWIMWPCLRFLLARIRRFTGWLLIGGAGSAVYAAAQFDAMLERISSVSGDTAGRTHGVLLGWFEAILSHPIGFGLGAAHQQAATFLGGERGFSLGSEEELTRIALELGVLGFLIFALSRVIFLIQICKSTLATREPHLRIVSAAAAMLFVVNIAGGVYTPIANAMFWSGVGVTLVIRNIRLANLAQGMR